MIRFKNEIYWDYFIHPVTGMITDEKGNIVEEKIYQCRPRVMIHGKPMAVHQIQSHTFYGYNGPTWHVHHRDGNPLNNDLYNLIYLPQEIHISLESKGRHRSKESRLKNRTAHLGKKASKETKEKMSKSRKGHLTTDSTKEKISNALKGHSISAESKDKISASLKKYYAEKRALISVSSIPTE